MGHNDYYDYDEASHLSDIMHYLIGMGQLENEVEINVAEKIRDNGANDLTPMQAVVFERIQRTHFTECMRCHSSELADMVSIISEGLCNYCEHVMNKDD